MFACSVLDWKAVLPTEVVAGESSLPPLASQTLPPLASQTLVRSNSFQVLERAKPSFFTHNHFGLDAPASIAGFNATLCCSTF
jgi:hypothetical protein